MSRKISISQKTLLSPVDIRKAVDDIFADLTDRYTLKGKWRGEKTFIISGEGISGDLTISNGSVDVKMIVCGALSAFIQIIETQVRQKLRIHLGVKPH